MTGGSLYPSGRKRILVEDVLITRESGKGKRFFISVKKDEYSSVPDDGFVNVMITESSFQRHLIALGLWKDLSNNVAFTVPAHLAGCFTSRLMVSSPSENSLGRLAATCEGLQIDTGDGPNILSPLLPAHYDPELGSYAWRFEVVNGYPQVSLNVRLQQYPDFVKSGYFRSLVLPEIVRRVLEWMFLEADPEEEGTQAQKWLVLLSEGHEEAIDSFLRSRQELHMQELHGLDEQSRLKVEQIVQSFCLPRSPIDELITELERQ